MDLTHTFTVPASLEETWAALNDIESVAGCFPGASVTSVEDEEFKGSCKVKLGPISLTYNGSGTFVEKDESARRFVVEAKGKDRRGNGTAAAKVTASMAEASPDSTEVEVVTELTITGRPAQFGRGVIQDVSDKLLQQFVACLEQKVGGGASDRATPESPAEASAAEAAAAAAAAGEVGATATGEPTVPKQPSAGRPEPDMPSAPPAAVDAAVDGGPVRDGAGALTDGMTAATQPPVEALDLGATILPVLLKRYWQPIVGALGGLIGLLLLIRILRRR